MSSRRVQINSRTIDRFINAHVLDDVYDELGPKIVRTAQILAAVDTGAGARSFHYEIEEEAGGPVMRIGPDKEHFYMSQFVEVGTRFMAARPALRPALYFHYTLSGPRYSAPSGAPALPSASRPALPSA